MKILTKMRCTISQTFIKKLFFVLFKQKTAKWKFTMTPACHFLNLPIDCHYFSENLLNAVQIENKIILKNSFMELNASEAITSNGEGTNITNEVKLFNCTLIPIDYEPEDPDTVKEVIQYPDLIPFVPVLVVLLVVLGMITTKYVIDVIKRKTLVRMARKR